MADLPKRDTFRCSMCRAIVYAPVEDDAPAEGLCMKCANITPNAMRQMQRDCVVLGQVTIHPNHPLARLAPK